MRSHKDPLAYPPKRVLVRLRSQQEAEEWLAVPLHDAVSEYADREPS